MIEPTKTLLYARISSIGQKTGKGISRQLEEGRAFCAAQGWPIDGTIKDEGRSAYHGHHRTIGNLGTFESDALAGLERGTRIVCENLDRLSRGDPEDSYDFIRSLTRNGVTIVTHTDGETYDAGKFDMMKVLKLLITFQRSNEEAVTKAKRSTSNWKIKHRLAKEEGRALSKRTHPWLKVVNGKYVLDSDRAPVIARIFQEADAGDGSLNITKMLNANYKPWGKAQCWHRSFVIRLLTNRAVVGEHIIDGEVVKLYPPVVAHDVFERVCANAEGRKEAKGGGRSEKMANLFSGFLRCAACNARMTMVGSYLQCLKASNGACKHTVKIAYAPFETAVLDSCLHLALDDNAFTNRAEVARLNETIAERTSDLAAARARAKSLWGFAATQKTVIAGEMAAEEEAKAKELAANVEALKQQRERAKGRASNLEHMQRVTDMRKRLGTDITLRKRVAQGFQSLITQVWFDKNGTATLMLAGGLKALMIRDGKVVKQADVVDAFDSGNIARLHFAGDRDRKGADSALKRMKASKGTDTVEPADIALAAGKRLW